MKSFRVHRWRTVGKPENCGVGIRQKIFRVPRCWNPNSKIDQMALNISTEHASVIATTPHTKPRPLNEAVVPSKTSCELAFAMPSARSEAMQTEVKGCGLAWLRYARWA